MAEEEGTLFKRLPLIERLQDILKYISQQLSRIMEGMCVCVGSISIYWKREEKEKIVSHTLDGKGHPVDTVNIDDHRGNNSVRLHIGMKH